MRSRSLAALVALSLLAGCADSQAEYDLAFARALQNARDRKKKLHPENPHPIRLGEARDGKLVVHVSETRSEFASGTAEAFADGHSVATSAFEGGKTDLALAPGTHEIEATSSDGERSEWLGDVTVLRTHCFHESGPHDKSVPRVERLVGFTHGRARLLDHGSLHVPRFVADDGLAPKTRIEWRRDGAVRTVTNESDTRSHSGWFGADPESLLADFLWPHSGSQCRVLWAMVDQPLSVPPEVWADRGPWTARVVTSGGQVLEVAFDSSQAKKEQDFDGDVVRTIALDVHVVAPNKDETAFLEAEEADLAVKPPEGQPYTNGAAIPLGAPIFRAAYREPAFTEAYSDFAIARVAVNNGTVDVGASVAHGLQRGESIASIDRGIAATQAGLDSDQNAENAYRKATVARLRPKLEAWIKKEGGPFQTSEFPPMYPAASE